jgi:hypothetical protein
LSYPRLLGGRLDLAFFTGFAFLTGFIFATRFAALTFAAFGLAFFASALALLGFADRRWRGGAVEKPRAPGAGTGSEAVVIHQGFILFVLLNIAVRFLDYGKVGIVTIHTQSSFSV